MGDDPKTRLERALLSLEGLAIGDGLGQRCFFRRPRVPSMMARRQVPRGRWDYTDDTRMALSIVAVLSAYATIDQDALACHFAKLYVEQPHRGYGPAMHELLPVLHAGYPWREAASALFSSAKCAFLLGSCPDKTPAKGRLDSFNEETVFVLEIFPP